MSKRKKIGLALGSGAVRGLVHVGVIKTFIKNNIPIDFMAGSSVGAWIAAHYGLYQNIIRLEEYTVKKKKEKLYTLLEPSLKGGIIKGQKMENLLNGWLNQANFSDTKIPIRIVATDLLNGEPVILDKGNLAFAARASMSIPTLFKPVEYKKTLLVDGGVCNPVPDDVVREMGADVVVSINLDNYRNRELNKDKLSLTNAVDKSFDIMRYYLASYSLKNSDFIIEPKFKDIELTSWTSYFTKDIGYRLVALGEKEARRIIKPLKKLANL